MYNIELDPFFFLSQIENRFLFVRDLSPFTIIYMSNIYMIAMLGLNIFVIFYIINTTCYVLAIAFLALHDAVFFDHLFNFF